MLALIGKATSTLPSPAGDRAPSRRALDPASYTHSQTSWTPSSRAAPSTTACIAVRGSGPSVTERLTSARVVTSSRGTRPASDAPSPAGKPGSSRAGSTASQASGGDDAPTRTVLPLRCIGQCESTPAPALADDFELGPCVAIKSAHRT